MSCKKYVEVTAKFDVDGTVFPLEIQWAERESGIPAGFEAGKNICGWKKPGGL